MIYQGVYLRVVTWGGGGGGGFRNYRGTLLGGWGGGGVLLIDSILFGGTKGVPSVGKYPCGPLVWALGLYRVYQGYMRVHGVHVTTPRGGWGVGYDLRYRRSLLVIHHMPTKPKTLFPLPYAKHLTPKL